MTAMKLRKKTSKTSKRSKAASKAQKKTLKLKAARSRKTSKAKTPRKPKFKPPAPHPDETAVRLGPHHVDRHPTAGFKVHTAPVMPVVTHLAMTSRHH